MCNVQTIIPTTYIEHWKINSVFLQNVISWKALKVKIRNGVVDVSLFARWPLTIEYFRLLLESIFFVRKRLQPHKWWITLYVNLYTRNIIAIVNAMRKLVVSGNYYFTLVCVFVCVRDEGRNPCETRPSRGGCERRPTSYSIIILVLYYIISYYIIVRYTRRIKCIPHQGIVIYYIHPCYLAWIQSQDVIVRANIVYLLQTLQYYYLQFFFDTCIIQYII